MTATVLSEARVESFGNSYHKYGNVRRRCERSEAIHEAVHGLLRRLSPQGSARAEPGLDLTTSWSFTAPTASSLKCLATGGQRHSWPFAQAGSTGCSAPSDRAGPSTIPQRLSGRGQGNRAAPPVIFSWKKSKRAVIGIDAPHEGRIRVARGT
jgi:hypothetical protein